MSEVRLPRVVVLFVLTLVVAGCAHKRDDLTAPGVCGRGGTPARDPQAPVVCIDDSVSPVRALPDRAEAHDVLKTDRATPVVVHWWTTSGGGDLGIQMKSDACVSDIRCETGHCWARTKPGAAGGSGGKIECKYDVWTTPANRLDPTLVVGTCCT